MCIPNDKASRPLFNWGSSGYNDLTNILTEQRKLMDDIAKTQDEINNTLARIEELIENIKE